MVLVYLRGYLLTVTAVSLVWEAGQMPLYTLWKTGSHWEIISDVLQCTSANIVIATGSLIAGLLIARAGILRLQASSAPIVATCAIGVGYTTYSEWLNVYVKGTWAYSDLMPVVPGLGVGLSPLLQWIVLPSLGIVVARSRANQRQSVGRPLI